MTYSVELFICMVIGLAIYVSTYLSRYVYLIICLFLQVAMTYSVELFICMVIGLVIGHAIFNTSAPVSNFHILI